MRRTVACATLAVLGLGFWGVPALARSGDHAGNWEVVFGHRHTMAEATVLEAQVTIKKFSATTEQDGTGDFEVEHDGLTRQQAVAMVKQARSQGLHANLERS